jgi:uncharacterized protein (DUF697 family)
LTRKKQADKIITTHILWAMGAGLVPLPLFDLAAVTAIQMDMLKQLSEVYGVNYSKSAGKGFITALGGGTLALFGGSLVKTIPVVGSLIGGVSVSVAAGASTYAIGRVAVAHFETSGDLSSVDKSWAQKAYQQAYQEGKQVVSDLEQKQEAAQDIFVSLEKLGQLKEKGLITEAEFETQKQKLLDRL